MNCQRYLQAHCQSPTSQRSTQALSKSLQSQRKKKLFLKNFPTLQKNKKTNAQPTLNDTETQY